MVRVYQIISLVLAIVFAMVGLMFALLPAIINTFFNGLSSQLGMADMPLHSTGLYQVLATGYMYVVTLLALMMYRHPDNRQLPLVLFNAKVASAIVSIVYFVMVSPYLIFLANGIVDGSLAVGVFWLRNTIKKSFV